MLASDFAWSWRATATWRQRAERELDLKERTTWRYLDQKFNGKRRKLCRCTGLSCIILQLGVTSAAPVPAKILSVCYSRKDILEHTQNLSCSCLAIPPDAFLRQLQQLRQLILSLSLHSVNNEHLPARFFQLDLFWKWSQVIGILELFLEEKCSRKHAFGSLKLLTRGGSGCSVSRSKEEGRFS